MKTSSYILGVGIACLCEGAALAAPSGNPEIAELRRQVEALTKTVKALQQQAGQSAAAAPAPAGDWPGADTSESAARDAGTNSLARRLDASIFNPKISAAIDVISSYSRRADNVNFIVRDAEIMIQSNVDHLARAYIALNAETELDATQRSGVFEEVSLGIEEAAIETTALPFGLALKAGQFFADFTRLGKVHSHELPFSDRPRSLDRIVGGETKARGLEANWVPPLGHYVRLTAGAVDNIGAEMPVTGRFSSLAGEETNAFIDADGRSFSHLVYYGRAASIAELGAQANLHLGANYAAGGGRRLAGVDFKLAWVPRPESYDLFELGGEYLWGRQRGRFGGDAAKERVDSEGTAKAGGAYIYAQYKIGKRWQPGLRFDYVRAQSFQVLDPEAGGGTGFTDRFSERVTSYSGYLGYYFSEFNRLRLQLSCVQGNREIAGGSRNDLQAFLQWTIILGPHQHSFVP